MIKKSSFYKKGGFWNFRFQISDFRFNLIKLFIPVILIAGFFVPYFSFAWDSHFTHRALTYEAGEFFNYFNDSQLSEEEINWLMQGAQEEDTPPRWINHFYNPITGEGWTGDKLGENSPGLVKFLSGFFLSSRTALSAKNWAKNRSAQADYSLYKGDQTWQKAIDAYLEGDRESAFVALGHILHLLEDMTVPDHTRGDTHAGIVGDKGSPLENWAKEYNKDKIGKLQTAEELYKSGQKPKDFSILENYFDWNAKYSSENFFSEDTINENLIAVPELIIGENQQIYGYINNYPVYTVKDNKETINDPQILTAYWQRLSKQAVISSAGVINLFFKEAERQSKLPQKMTKKSNTTTNTIWSPFGELTKLYNTAVQFAQGFFPQSTKADESVNDEIVTSQANSGDERLSEQASPPSEKGDLGGFNNNQSTIINQQSIIPDPTPASESITEPETNFYVSQVIDGDTITLNSGEDVRLIGMDTPERGEECFEEAKQKMESMVLGKNIRLEKDTSETDKYNRLLRYIYIDGVLVNAEMLKEGYAHLMMIRPDTKYYSAFKSYEEEAKFFERGCLFQKEGVGGADPIDETPVYTGWSSAGGSSKPAPQAPKEETPTSTPETATSTLEVILEDITSTSTPQTSTSTPQTSTSTPETSTSTPETATSTLEIPEILPNIIINEIQISGGPGDTDNEFIELYNNSSGAVDITDWKLFKKTETVLSYNPDKQPPAEYNLVSKFPTGSTIPANSYFLIVPKNAIGKHADTNYTNGSNFATSDDTLIIRDADGNIIDKVGFGLANDYEVQQTYNPLDGQSISRTNFIDTNNNFNDFTVSSSTPQGTSSTMAIAPEPEPEPVIPPVVPEPSAPTIACTTFTYGTHNKEEGEADKIAAEPFPDFSNTLTVTLEAGKTYYTDDTISIPNNRKLIIEEGVVLKFGRWRWGGWMNFPISLRILGDLEVNGTASNPVIFTTFRDDAHGVAIDISGSEPAPGDWGSIQIESPNGKDIKIQHAKIYYAGGAASAANSSGGAIFVNFSDADIEISDIEVSHSQSGIYSRLFPGTQPNILNSNFEYNALWGISAQEDSAIRIIGNTFQCNGLTGNSGTTGGVNVVGNPENIVIENNDFINNKIGLNFYNDNPDIELNAQNNYWGAESGPWHETKNPAGAGDIIQGNVDFNPWTEIK